MPKSKKIITLKDMPEGLLLDKIKLRLPESTYLASRPPYYKIDNVPINIVGSMPRGFLCQNR